MRLSPTPANAGLSGRGYGRAAPPELYSQEPLRDEIGWGVPPFGG
jgi:hypothetical protein